jgi:hypothetical protein
MFHCFKTSSSGGTMFKNTFKGALITLKPTEQSFKIVHRNIIVTPHIFLSVFYTFRAFIKFVVTFPRKNILKRKCIFYKNLLPQNNILTGTTAVALSQVRKVTMLILLIGLCYAEKTESLKLKAVKTVFKQPKIVDKVGYYLLGNVNKATAENHC